MSEAHRGFIQYAQNAKQDRKFALQNMFDGYVAGFIERAYEIPTFCPSCEWIEMRATVVQRVPEGVSGTWQCQNCGHVGEKFVPIEKLVEDFNLSRKCHADRVLTFEEWRMHLKMKMSKANIPCHEKPDKTIVGKFGGEYREMDLETQKRRYHSSIAESGKGVSVNA